MIDLTLALATGISYIPFEEAKTVIHQPTLEEMAMMGEDDVFAAIQTLTVHKSMVTAYVENAEALLETMSNFDIFMAMMADEQFADKKKCITNFAVLIFPEYNMVMTPNSLLFIPKQGDGETVMIDKNNYDAFQNYIRHIFCVVNTPMDKTSFNPVNKKAEEIAKKLMRGRERVAAEKGTNSENKNIISRYISILSVGLRMPLTEIKKWTMYQLFDTFERFVLSINWKLDTDIRLAGGKPEGEIENWMKNIH